MSQYIHNWFSNFELTGFQIQDEYGICYDTVENYFQAAKTLDKDHRARIALMTPGKAKREGRMLSLRPDWEDIKISIMDRALRLKFAKGTKWYDKLMSTGDEEIIEFNNWKDIYWGYDVNLRRGRNELGKLLMKIRQDYRPESLTEL